MCVSLKAIAGHLIAIVQPNEGGYSSIECCDYYCVECGMSPMRVAGSGIHFASGKDRHDTYEANAYCTQCKVRVGTLRVRMSTLFGIEEDERVLNGRCRCY